MNDKMMREFLQMVAKKLAEEPKESKKETPSITTGDILLDFKIFANDIYEGTIEEEDGDSLVLAFQNGQKFRIIIREIKLQLSLS